MARIANVNIPANKRLVVSLTYIYGIGKTSAEEICAAAKISPDTRVKDLDDKALVKIREVIEKSYEVEEARRKVVKMNIENEKRLKSYRGIRHIRGLPVRGQNTASNARTRKGKAVAIAGKKK